MPNKSLYEQLDWAFNALLKFDLTRQFQVLAETMAFFLNMGCENWSDEDEYSVQTLTDAVFLPQAYATVVPV
jgi:hypothetical protein